MEIVLGIDATAADQATVAWAIDHVTPEEGVLVAAYGGDATTRERVATRARDRLAEAGFDVSVSLLEDDPGARLVELAETGDYDCIAVHGGSRSPLGKIQLDTVVEFVVLNARTSVTLVR